MQLSDMLVVSDMDGTLLQANYGVPRENIEAIERFIDAGGRFTVCTGRSVDSVRRYVDWISFSAPAVTCNGAIVYDFNENKQLWGAELNPIVFDVVRELVRMFPGLGIEFHDCNGIVMTRTNHEALEHCSLEHIPFVAADITEVEHRIFNKVLMAGPAELCESVQNFIEQRKKKDPNFAAFDYVKSSPIYYEILPKGVNKGVGLKKLAELTGTDVKNIIAIGDYYNDIEMFRVAGHTISVADAPAEIRGMTDTTTQKSCLAGAVGEVLDSVKEMCGDYTQLKFDL